MTEPSRAIPLLYDYVQRLAGLGAVRRHLAPHLADLHGQVLDVGAGTGLYAQLLPADAGYVGVDLAPQELQRLQARCPGAVVVVADATSLPFDDASFDNALCINILHHLSDVDLARVIAELVRVVRGRVVFLDPVLSDRTWSRALWSIDRGSHPRSAESLRETLGGAFDLEHFEDFRIRHTYVLAVARPRAAAS